MCYKYDEENDFLLIDPENCNVGVFCVELFDIQKRRYKWSWENVLWIFPWVDILYS